MQSVAKLAPRVHGQFVRNSCTAIHHRDCRTRVISQWSSRHKPSCLAAAAAAATGSIETPKEHVETVGEVMTRDRLHTVRAETTVPDALELLVNKRVTGLPVVDDGNHVIGVVSDFDLLASDFHSSSLSSEIFPSLDQSWESFKSLQKLIEKSEGKLVEDVMTPNAIVVRSETSIEAASRILFESKTRRLPVVNEEGVLIGILTRRDIIVAALAARKAQQDYFTDDEDIVTMA
eukprot:g997.t1